MYVCMHVCTYVNLCVHIICMYIRMYKYVLCVIFYIYICVIVNCLLSSAVLVTRLALENEPVPALTPATVKVYSVKGLRSVIR